MPGAYAQDKDAIRAASAARRAAKRIPGSEGKHSNVFKKLAGGPDKIEKRAGCRQALITSCNEASLKPGSKARREYYRDPLVRECRIAAGDINRGKYASCYKKRKDPNKGKCTKLVKTAMFRHRVPKELWGKNKIRIMALKKKKKEEAKKSASKKK